MSYARKANDYCIDYDVQSKYMMSGIPFLVNLQDRAMTEDHGRPSTTAAASTSAPATV